MYHACSQFVNTYTYEKLCGIMAGPMFFYIWQVSLFRYLQIQRKNNNLTTSALNFRAFIK